MLEGIIGKILSILGSGLVLSRKFCSAENFGQGPIFSENIVPPRTNFPEKRTGAENFVPVYILVKKSIVRSCMTHEEADQLYMMLIIYALNRMLKKFYYLNPFGPCKSIRGVFAALK